MSRESPGCSTVGLDGQKREFYDVEIYVDGVEEKDKEMASKDQSIGKRVRKEDKAVKCGEKSVEASRSGRVDEGCPFAVFAEKGSVSNGLHLFQSSLFHMADWILGVSPTLQERNKDEFHSARGEMDIRQRLRAGLYTSVNTYDKDYFSFFSPFLDRNDDEYNFSASSPSPFSSLLFGGVEGSKDRKEKLDGSMRNIEKDMLMGSFSYPLHRYTVLLAHRDAPYVSNLIRSFQKKRMTGGKRTRSGQPSSEQQ